MGEHSFMNALLLCCMIRGLFAHCVPRADGHSVFCGGSRFDQSFYIDGALGGLSSWPGGPTTSFTDTEGKALLGLGPSYTCSAYACLSQNTERPPLEKTHISTAAALWLKASPDNPIVTFKKNRFKIANSLAPFTL